MPSDTVLIMDRNRGFHTWLDTEIYVGPQSTGKYVPNVNDMVLSWDSGLFRVIWVDETTGLSTLKPWSIPNINTELQSGFLLGDLDDSSKENFRLYIDTRVTPYKVAFDSRLHIYGSASHHLKLFKGTDTTVGGQVISAIYNQSGDLVSDNVPLELVGSVYGTNTAIQTPVLSSTIADLDSGEIVTAVIYDTGGSPVSIRRLLVKRTDFVRSGNAALRHITGISLVSPFLSATVPDTINYPLNLPISSMFMSALVSYNDGSSRTVQVDGNRMSLLGADNYIPSIVGQKIPLVLRYTLDSNETTFAAAATNGVITRAYDAITVAKDLTYGVKLYVIPRWVDTLNGYELSYWLYDINRTTARDVTAHVTVDVARGMVYDPTRYGVRQNIALVINLQDVSTDYLPFVHVQTLAITLMSTPDSRTDPFRIDYNSDDVKVYGSETFALLRKPGSNWELDLSSGQSTTAEWLIHLYQKIDPLVNTPTESTAPIPTHMRITIGSDTYYRQVSEWAVPITVPLAIPTGTVASIAWIHETGTNNLELGITPISITNA